MKYFIAGGIGDFVQSVDSLVNLQNSCVDFELDIFTHFKGAKEFFAPFLFKKDAQFHFFKDREEYIKVLSTLNGKTKAVPKIMYQDFAVPSESMELAEKLAVGRGKIIGIHPVGSKFANVIYSLLNWPAKVMPPSTVKYLIQPNHHYFIFGAEEDLVEYKKIIPNKNVFWISYPNIWDSLAHVMFCDFVIGVDSSIKSFSTAKQIPTVVALSDVKDEIRDQNFILPYEKTGVMKVYRYKNLLHEEAQFVKFALSQQNEILRQS